MERSERRAVATFTGRLRILFEVWRRVEHAARAENPAAFQGHPTLDYLALVNLLDELSQV